VIWRRSHPGEDRLFDAYLSRRAGECVDPRTAEHLEECHACAARFDELRRFMDGLWESADRDLDEAFSAADMAQQRHQIARRIASLGRSGRVIHFPPVPGAVAQAPRPRPLLPHWAAATAAAGLLVGVAAGMFIRGTAGTAAGVSAPVAVAVAEPEDIQDQRPEAPSVDADVDADDVFLDELEVAAGGPRTAELAALDALTPHIREVSLSVPAR
jgi:anti-sigma factor RsiW